MSWNVKFWWPSKSPPSIWNWNAPGNVAPSEFPGTTSGVLGGQTSQITAHLNSIAAVSTIASARLNGLGQDIRFGYSFNEVGRAFATNTSASWSSPAASILMM